MDAATLHAAIDWIGQYPAGTGAGVFLIALAGSLAVVGMFVYPGVVLFAAGTLVGAGALGLPATLAWAIAGTLLGDGLSFWLGRRFKERLRQRWPFRRYPHWLARGERFFLRHGGKSLFFGRFVGPVVPVAAGMLGIAPRRFFAADMPSVVLWVLAFVLPGMALGVALMPG